MPAVKPNAPPAAARPRRPRKRHFSMLRDFQVADFLTLGNGLSGMGSILATMQFLVSSDRRLLTVAFALLPVALICDVLDGRVARIRKESSLLGQELDSLADLVSFGVAPAVLGFAVGLRGGWDAAGLLYFVLCGLSRLARYNATAAQLADSTGKVRYFEGTPIPTSLLLVAVLAWLFKAELIGDALPLGVLELGPFVLHPLTMLFVTSGSAMVSKTLHIPKPLPPGTAPPPGARSPPAWLEPPELPVEVQQRLALAHLDPQHLAHQDGVIAPRQPLVGPALEVRNCPLEQRQARLGPGHDAHPLELVRPLRRQLQRHVGLLDPQHADRPARRAHEYLVRVRSLVDAHQHQRRIQRQRAERAGREADGLALGPLAGDNRDAARPARERAPERGRIDEFLHGVPFLAPSYPEARLDRRRFDRYPITCSHPHSGSGTPARQHAPTGAAPATPPAPPPRR
jgi:CDP-diacylglycerol---serine O-phosphatidyltransferase